MTEATSKVFASKPGSYGNHCGHPTSPHGSLSYGHISFAHEDPPYRFPCDAATQEGGCKAGPVPPASATEFLQLAAGYRGGCAAGPVPQLSIPNLCPRKARPVAAIEVNWVMEENFGMAMNLDTEEDIANVETFGNEEN